MKYLTRKNSVILEVTADEYELPVAVFLDEEEIAKRYNTTKNSIQSLICKQKKGVNFKTYRGTKFVKVRIDNEENKEC